MPVVDLGDTVTISIDVNDQLRGASQWFLYADSLNTTPIDSAANGMFAITPPVASTTYLVRGEGNGIIGREGSIDITVNPLPVVDLGNDTSVCQGDTLTLDATTPGATYLWRDNSTDFTFDVTDSGIYWVDVTVAGCINRDSIEITYNLLPVVDIGNDTTLCAGELLTLDATNPGATYLWQDASTDSTFDVSVEGLYHVEVMVIGCPSVIDTIDVSLNSFVVDLGNDTSLCQGDTLTLDATNPGATYLWQDASTDSTFDVSVEGLYYVEVMVGACPSVIDTIDVSLNPLPTASITANGSVLTASNGVSYEWIDCADNSLIAGETGMTYTATIDGSYAVIVTDVCGSDTSACELVLVDGIDENSFGSTINLYPNPTSGDVLLELGEVRDAVITLSDVTGKTISVVESGNESNILLPLRDFHHGIYLITITANNQQKVMKLVKE